MPRNEKTEDKIARAYAEAHASRHRLAEAQAAFDAAFGALKTCMRLGPTPPPEPPPIARASDGAPPRPLGPQTQIVIDAMREHPDDWEAIAKKAYGSGGHSAIRKAKLLAHYAAKRGFGGVVQSGRGIYKVKP